MSEETILNAIAALDEKLSRKIEDFRQEVDRRFNILEQDVKGLRSLIGEVVEMAPDVIANRDHLQKLERKQDRFNLRLEEAERKIAGMA